MSINTLVEFLLFFLAILGDSEVHIGFIPPCDIIFKLLQGQRVLFLGFKMKQRKVEKESNVILKKDDEDKSKEPKKSNAFMIIWYVNFSKSDLKSDKI